MKISARAWWVIATALPCALVFWANAIVVWNHFIRGPFLHDSGWYAAIVWHNGLFPKNPPSTHSIVDYYAIHFSPLVSFASVASYLAPIGRTRWYCVFQGAIYLPLAWAVAALAERTEKLGAALVVALVALVFAFDGQALMCMGYPHYEIAIPAGCCLMLAGLATKRGRLAWFGLVLAAASREDGGFHAAFFAFAVLACDVTKRPFPVARRTLMFMGVVAGAVSVLAFVLQKSVFHGANLFRHEYLGEPAFAHITRAVLANRTRDLVEHAAFIPLTMGATLVLAVVRRDARYLLGWIVELPWLVLNFLALQELKAVFSIYTGFPFVASIFWVAAYGRVAAPKRRWMMDLVPVSLLSTAGYVYSFHDYRFLERSFLPGSVAAGRLEYFADAIDHDPAAFGPILVDPAVAAWAPSRITNQVLYAPLRASSDGKIGVAFFATGFWERSLFQFLAMSPFRVCGEMPDTPLRFCARERSQLAPGFVPTPLEMGAFVAQPRVRREGFSFVVPTAPPADAEVYGPYAAFSAGTYRATWHIRWQECTPSLPESAARAHFDVVRGDHIFGSAEVTTDDPDIDVTFTLPVDVEGLELRSFSGRCGYVFDDLSIASVAGQL